MSFVRAEHSAGNTPLRSPAQAWRAVGRERLNRAVKGKTRPRGARAGKYLLGHRIKAGEKIF